MADGSRLVYMGIFAVWGLSVARWLTLCVYVVLYECKIMWNSRRAYSHI